MPDPKRRTRFWPWCNERTMESSRISKWEPRCVDGWWICSPSPPPFVQTLVIVGNIMITHHAYVCPGSHAQIERVFYAWRKQARCSLLESACWCRPLCMLITRNKLESAADESFRCCSDTPPRTIIATVLAPRWKTDIP